MISTDYIRLMAAYTGWQNHSIYSAGETLSEVERRRERGAFFGSIHATLNHLLWAIQAEVRHPRWVLVIQLFNHGTHHRGQMHAMLNAAGAKPDGTDVPFLASEQYPWPD